MCDASHTRLQRIIIHYVTLSTHNERRRGNNDTWIHLPACMDAACPSRPAAARQEIASKHAQAHVSSSRGIHTVTTAVICIVVTQASAPTMLVHGEA
ncbi:MAG: hypothetical protein JW384_01658 [Nitrosomonadaceae bacterium]|nr:hypothetical protein [Nitrosomonadaceae bacterium]